MFLEYLVTNFDDIPSWFENKMNITPKKRYNIFLEQTLYYVNFVLPNENITGLINHIKMHSHEFFDIFVIDLYNYLCNKCNNNYLSDPTPDYINITLIFVKENFNVFHHAVQRSPFGEEGLKNELYRYFCYFCNKNKFTDSITLI